MCSSSECQAQGTGPGPMTGCADRRAGMEPWIWEPTRGWTSQGTMPAPNRRHLLQVAEAAQPFHLLRGQGLGRFSVRLEPALFCQQPPGLELATQARHQLWLRAGHVLGIQRIAAMLE